MADLNPNNLNGQTAGSPYGSFSNGLGGTTGGYQPVSNGYVTPKSTNGQILSNSDTPAMASTNPINNQSTTTLSNGNKMTQVPSIVNTTNQLAQTGVTTDPNSGVATHADGTAYNPPVPAQAPTPASTSGTTATGGYVGDMYYAPGATLPKDASGNYASTTQTSPTDDAILASLNTQKAQSDSMTASLITSIQNNYANLIQQQQQTNAGQQGSVQNALLMGGGTGKGSSAQYAPISSSGVISSQINYGIQQIADLNSKEQAAIVAAQQAGQNADFKLQDQINQQISSIRDTKVAAATDLNNKIAAQNQKLADQKQQSDLDNAIGNLYSTGTTDPATILSQLKSQGVQASADDVNKALSTFQTQSANQKDVNAIALEVAKNGTAPADVIAKVNAAKNAQEALNAAGPYISDILGNQIKKAQLEKLNLDNKKAIEDAKTGGSSTVPIANEVTGTQVNIPTAVAPYVNTASNGTMYADLSGAVGTAAEKTKLVNQAQQAGLKIILNKNTAADLVNIKDANSKLDTISGIFDGISQPNWLARDLGGLGLTKLSSLAQTNPQVAASGALQSVGLDMLKAISGVQGFRGNSAVVQQINDHLPKVTDTKDVVNQKVNYIKALISDREDAAVGVSSNNTTSTNKVIEYNGKKYSVDASGNMTAL